MKTSIIAVMLTLFAVNVQAGDIVSLSYTHQGDAGVTLFASTSGVSHLFTKDLSRMFDYQNKASLSFPEAVYFADTTADPGGTGNTATAGSGVSFFYIVHNRELTGSELESIGISGLTRICAIPLNSSSTRFTVQPFSPDLGKYLSILAQAGVTNIRKPGCSLVIQ